MAQRGREAAVRVHDVQITGAIEPRPYLCCPGCRVREDRHVEGPLADVCIPHRFQVERAIEVVRVCIAERRNDEAALQVNRRVDAPWMPAPQNALHDVERAWGELGTGVPLAVLHLEHRLCGSHRRRFGAVRYGGHRRTAGKGTGAQEDHSDGCLDEERHRCSTGGIVRRQPRAWNGCMRLSLAPWLRVGSQGSIQAALRGPRRRGHRRVAADGATIL